MGRPGKTFYERKISEICEICPLATCIWNGNTPKGCPVLKDIKALRGKFQQQVDSELERERRVNNEDFLVYKMTPVEELDVTNQ